jgi:hypothetical protein
MDSRLRGNDGKSLRNVKQAIALRANAIRLFFPDFVAQNRRLRRTEE